LPIKPKTVKEVVEKKEYTCLCCGNKKKEDEFFISKWSKVWNETDKHVLFCKDCLNKLFVEFTNRFNSEKTALIICCAYLDVPFYATLYQSIIEKNSFFNIGMYLRQTSLRQYQYKSFLNSIVEGELEKTQNEVKEEIESKWTKKDKQNMNYVLSVFGYDPFEYSGLTNADRKYCFNVLTGYCDTEGVRDDGHKMLSCIQITNLQLQCKKFDELINEELLQQIPNDSKIKSYTSSKKQLLDSIATLCKDNNISSAYNSTSKAGKNTLTQKMKEMFDAGIDSVKVNLFDIETCECMKQIADCSNRSIMEQLTFDSNEYSSMLKEQREMIQQFQSDNSKLEEENRLLKNQIIDLSKTVKSR